MGTTTRVAGIVAGLTLSLGSLGALTAPSIAHADAPASAPCAKEQTQVDRAHAALERVTAVFERQQAKVTKAKRHAAAADAGREKAAAKRALAEARHDRTHAKKAKKAQLQRVEKAEARLAACEAEQPDEA